MSGARKLQSEIERTLKRVNEGVEAFDDIWEKVYSATQQNQKEKYEVDLKKEIKKLQRFRDQIKTWVASSDVKDKNPLIECRRLIETKMEQFKICERETKTKAYSKEGLAQGHRLDPRSRAKENTRSWVQEALNNLEQQIEALESDVEMLSGGKGRNKNKSEIEKLEGLISKIRWHTDKLELILRLVHNDALRPEDVDKVRDDVEYYVEANQDAEYIETYGQTDIYEELELDGSLSLSAVAGSGSSYEGAMEHGDESGKRERSAESSSQGNGRKDSPSSSSASVSFFPASSSTSSPSSSSSASSATAFSSSSATPLSAAVVSTTAQPSSSFDLPGSAGAGAAASGAPTSSFAAAASKSVASTPASSAAGLNLANPTLSSVVGNGKPDSANFPSRSAVGHEAGQERGRGQGGSATQAGSKNYGGPEKEQSRGILGSFADGKSSLSRENARGGRASEQGLSGQNRQIGSQAADEAERASKGQSADGRGSVEALSQELRAELSLLDTSLKLVPETRDAERPKMYLPRNPYPTPLAFPSTPSILFDSPAVFDKFDTDTLFFIFYFQQGSYQQYLAARELKKQSWRYHKKYMTWFQRHEEPKATSDEYEQGTYVYFDYETGWCQRIKSDFTFEYCFLEDELIL